MGIFECSINIVDASADPRGNKLILYMDLILKLGINLLFLLVLLRGIYYVRTPNRESFVSIFLFGNGVFFITVFLHRVDMSMGFAFGMFAVFSMLRYRTESMSLRDMTYLFVAIVIALLSAVGPESVWVVSVADSLLCLLVALSESEFLVQKIEEKTIEYERIENIVPSRYGAMVSDIERRTGLTIQKARVGNINFLKDTARVRIYYREPEYDMSCYGETEPAPVAGLGTVINRVSDGAEIK